MALVDFTGFESGEFGVYPWKSSGDARATTGRTGANALELYSLSGYLRRALGGLTTVAVGFACRAIQWNSRYGSGPFPAFYPGDESSYPSTNVGKWGPYVRWHPGGTFDLCRREPSGTETVLAAWPTGRPGIPLTDWTYVEVLVDLDGTGGTGAMTLKLNNETVLTLPSGTLLMQDTTKNSIETIGWHGGNYSASYNYASHVDDLYIDDAQLRGQVRVHPLMPTAVGSHNDFTGSDGDKVDSHLLVDDVVPSATDYVQSSTSGAKQTFQLGDLPASVTSVLAVRPVWSTAAPSGHVGAFVPFLKQGAAEREYAARGFGETHKTIEGDLDTTKPGGGGWTPADVNALEIGLRVV